MTKYWVNCEITERFFDDYFHSLSSMCVSLTEGSKTICPAFLLSLSLSKAPQCSSPSLASACAHCLLWLSLGPWRQKQRGVCSYCPAQDRQLVSGHKLSWRLGVVGGPPGGFTSPTLKHGQESNSMRQWEKGARKWERERGRCIVRAKTKSLSSPLSETAVM